MQKQLQNLKVKHLTKRNTSSTGVNGNIENHNPNTTSLKQSQALLDKREANSVESTHGSSGAAKYLIN